MSVGVSAGVSVSVGVSAGVSVGVGVSAGVSVSVNAYLVGVISITGTGPCAARVTYASGAGGAACAAGAVCPEASAGMCYSRL